MATQINTDSGQSDDAGRAAHAAEQHREATHGSQRRPMGLLLRELAGESTALLRAEVTLAKIELREGLGEVQRGLISAATGAAIFLAGLLALVAAAILGLAVAWPAWLAALVIGGGLAIVGFALLATAKRKTRARELIPERFIETLEDDREFVREEMEMAKERLQ